MAQDNNFHSIPNTTYFVWNHSTAIIANNLCLLVIDFGLAHRLLSPSFIHLCTNLHAQHYRAHSCKHQMNRVSGIDSISLWGAYHGVLSDTPMHWVCCVANVPSLNRTPDTIKHAVSRIRETNCDTTYTTGLATLFQNYMTKQHRI